MVPCSQSPQKNPQKRATTALETKPKQSRVAQNNPLRQRDRLTRLFCFQPALQPSVPVRYRRHMNNAANVLNAVGGSPDFDNPVKKSDTLPPAAPPPSRGGPGTKVLPNSADPERGGGGSTFGTGARGNIKNNVPTEHVMVASASPTWPVAHSFIFVWVCVLLAGRTSCQSTRWSCRS